MKCNGNLFFGWWKFLFMDEIDHTHVIGHMGEMNYIDELELQKWNWSQRLN
jgi:hypothetical protein